MRTLYFLLRIPGAKYSAWHTVDVYEKVHGTEYVFAEWTHHGYTGRILQPTLETKPSETFGRTQKTMKVLVSGAICYFKQLLEINRDIQFNFWKSLRLFQLKRLKWPWFVQFWILGLAVGSTVEDLERERALCAQRVYYTHQIDLNQGLDSRCGRGEQGVFFPKTIYHGNA